MNTEKQLRLRQMWQRTTQKYNSQMRLGRDVQLILVSLLNDGPIWGSALARRCGIDQGNTLGTTLPRLLKIRLVNWSDIGSVQSGKRVGGGKSAKEWYLTPRGREMAIMIVEKNNELSNHSSTTEILRSG